MPLVGLPVPETNSWTARAMSSSSVSGCFRLGLLGQGGPYAYSGVRDHHVEGVALPVRHVTDVGVGALRGHAVLSGVVDKFGEDLNDLGAHAGGAQPSILQVFLQGVGQVLGFLHGVEGGRLQTIFDLVGVHCAP